MLSGAGGGKLDGKDMETGGDGQEVHVRTEECWWEFFSERCVRVYVVVCCG